MANRDNSALNTLKFVAWVCVVVGAVLLVIGWRGHDVAVGVYSYRTETVPSYGPLITGAALLGIAFQAWLLMLVFWAVQWDRASTPGYTAPAPRSPYAPDPGPNRVQREAAQRATQAAKSRPVAWSEEG